MADLKIYNLLRPALLKLKEANPRAGWSMCTLSHDQSVVLDRDLDQEKNLGPSGPRIRCPLCGWSPREEDKWFCTCGHEWNTFDTGTVCPACTLQWNETQCLSCRGWSPHSECLPSQCGCCLRWETCAVSPAWSCGSAHGQSRRSGWAPPFQWDYFLACFLPACSPFQPRLRGAGVDYRRSTPASQMQAGWGPAVAASLLPISGELNVQMCSLTPGLKLSHFR